MKRKLLFMLTLTLVVACAVGLAACGDDNSDEHKLTHVVAVDATCTEDGNVEYWYCSDCGKYFSDAEATIEVSQSDTIIPAQGHTYGEWKTIKEATCREDGERSKECSVCHYVETEVIITPGHSFSDWNVIAPATCTTDGEQARTCTKCQYKETVTVYALGHEIQNNVCTRCGATATEGLRFKYVQGDRVEGVFCIGWDEEHTEGHGYSHDETEYGTLDLIIPDVYEGYPVIGVSQEWACSFLGDLCIRSVTLPDSVIYIDDQAFSGCEYLQSVSVGSDIDYIGEWVFEDTAFENTADNYENGLLYLISRDRETKWLIKAQKGLTNAVLAENTRFVVADAFSDCDDTLSSITFGTSIPFFYDVTFSGFDNLKNVYYNGTLEDWIKIEFYSDSANPLSNGANLYLNGTLLTELTTPTGMTEIGNHFIGCTSLEKVTVLEGVTEIGNMSFSGCTNISALILPDSLKTIGYDAFSDCRSLTSVTLPKSLESIGKDVFRGCKQLSAIQLDSSNTSFAVRDGVLYNADFTELVYIPEGFSGILQLPDGVDLSNYNAIEYFERCENLTGIEVSENHLYHKSYNGIVYSEPDEYGSQFMYVAPGISGKIVLPDDIIIVSGFSGMDYTASGYAGRDITEIVFGENTKVIESNAFTNCTQLTSVVIPDSVTSIGAMAFKGCMNLKSVVIGNGVVEIGYYAFKDCPLESAVFKHYTGWTVRGEDVTEEQLMDPKTAAELLSDEKYDGWTNTGTYRVDFVIDGVIVKSVTYTPNDASTVVPPQIPEKEGYSASWEEYSLTGDIVVNAMYTAIPYTVTFIADGETISEQTYTVEDYNISIPVVPEKTGYTGKWDYTLKEGDVGDIIVNAVYETIPYTVTFVADGEIIAEEIYTVEDYDINIPEVPAKKGYDGAWESYSMTTGNITVNASYSIITYYVTFIADGEIVAVESYTVEDYDINVPIVPEKEHYVAKWGNYVLADGTIGDFTVNAEYTAIQYTITFIVEDYEWSKISYTIENYEDFVLPIPPERVGYEAVWEEVEWLTNDTIHALYTTVGATEGLQYSLSEDGKSYSVVGYTGTDSEVIIPDLIKSIPVINIGERAFEDSSLISVKIPGSIISIGYRTFGDCNSLSSISIPNNVASIGASAFWGCSSLISVTIGKGVKSIGDNAFYNCSSLKKVFIMDMAAWCEISFAYEYSNPLYYANLYLDGELVTELIIPDGVTTIGNYTFYNCLSITIAKIPDSVKNIGEDAFKNCSSLTSVTIGNGIKSIGERAFEDCNALEEVCLTDIAVWCGISFDDFYSNPLYYAHLLYLNGELATELIIPDEVTIIESYAFLGCSSLNKIVFHDNVKKIESQAFYNCESLISVVIGNGITEIGTQAFNICTSLTNVTLGTSLNSIGWSAFAGCYKLVDVYNLSSLNITKGSSDNGHVAYYALNVYTSIEEQGKFTTTDDGYVFYEDGENIWLVGYNGIETELTLPDKFNGKNYAINQRALYNKSFTSIIIPDCVISIGDYAFSECGVLTSVIIGNGVTSIGDNAFASCYSLTTVIIGNNVTILGNYVFSDCNSLTSITIPEGVTVIGDYAFAQCSSLTKIIIPNGVTSIGENAFVNCGLLTSITIPDGVTYIEDGTFWGCNSLKDIAIPNSVISIENRAFAFCSSLTNISIPKNLKSIGENAFENCELLKNIYITDMLAWCNISFSNGNSNPLCHMGNLYLNGELVTNLVIPDGVTNIGNYAFYACSSLTSITIPNCVTNIGDYAFCNCSTITNVIIGNVVESIGDYAFAYCNELTNVTIGNSVASIGSWAFGECKSLINITIPDSVKNIEVSVFSGCISLKSIIFNGTKVQWNTINKDFLWNDGIDDITVHCTDGDITTN